MHFYTSVNINYLAKARVLAKSVKKYCKNSKFSLVFSDRWPAELKMEDEPFDEIITVDMLGLPVPNLNLWIFQHTVVELCTAVKGQALVKFLEEGSEKVVYLDPDIAVFNNLQELESLLDKYDVVLTPHVTIPEETLYDIANNEICALKHGTYNFGFYAVKNSNNGMAYARWWRDRLIEFCYDDIPSGIFTDQKWGDLAPGLFDGIYITRDPGYNVSTWNITQRKVDKNEDGLYIVNDVPLKFYHFSGFDSGNQETMLNLYSEGNAVLYELRQWYIRKQEEEGQSALQQKLSFYNYYDNGEKIKNSERTLLRRRLDVLNYFKETNPYVTKQEKSYYDWYKAENIGEEDSENMRLQAENSNLKEELRSIYESKAWKTAMKLRGWKHLFRRQ